jgi:hypothetical protein
MGMGIMWVEWRQLSESRGIITDALHNTALYRMCM